MKNGRLSEKIVDLARRCPAWAERNVVRFSRHKAKAALDRHRAKRREAARGVSSAIYRVQDQDKAFRSFRTLSFLSAVTAVGYCHTGDLTTAGIWSCTAPFLLLHARKTLKEKRKAQVFLLKGSQDRIVGLSKRIRSIE